MPISTTSAPNTAYSSRPLTRPQQFGCGQDALRCNNTVQFGSTTEADTTTPNTDKSAESTKEGGLKETVSALLQDIRNSILESIESLKQKVLGQFQPTLAGIAVLSHASAWNKVLKEVNPDSKFQQRLTTICDLAYVVFRDQSKAIINKDLQRNGTETDPANQALIDDVLKLFPGLKKLTALPGSYPLSPYIKAEEATSGNK